MERLWVLSLQGVDPSHNVSGFEMKPTPTMAAKALKNSEQCHSSCTICQSTSQRRYKNFERNPRPAKVAKLIPFLAMWTFCEVGPRLPTLNHRNHDWGSFQFSLKVSKTLNSSVLCSRFKIQCIKQCDGALRKIRAKPAEKIGAVCPRIWESLVLPVNRGMSGDPIIQSLSSKTLPVASAKLTEIQNLGKETSSSSLSSFRCSTQNL